MAYNKLKNDKNEVQFAKKKKSSVIKSISHRKWRTLRNSYFFTPQNVSLKISYS